MKKFVSLFMILSIILLICGCKSINDKSQLDNSLNRVIESGELKLGLDSNYPPMGFIGEDGTITGFDIEVAQEVCDRLNIKLVTHPIIWEEKEQDLKNYTIDCIWNGMSVTPGRMESMTLSDPYMKNELIFVILNDSDIHSMEDLKGKHIGVQSGSSTEDALKEIEIFSEITMEAYPDNLMILDKLNNHELDAILIDSVAAYYYIFSIENESYILPDSISEENLAIGFRKGDQELCNKIQQVISEMKADGTLGEISTKWFGSDITIVK